jgi:hypothetical protein
MSLNPRIKVIELGIEEMSEYKIYPLSMADEFKLSDIISKAAGTITEMSDGASEVAVVQASIDVIKANLGIILDMVTKKTNRPKIDDIDNEQFSELAELIFDVNFAGTIKNFQSLVKKVKGMFPSTGLSQSSSETPVTE